jgi:hypothetical protein
VDRHSPTQIYHMEEAKHEHQIDMGDGREEEELG